MGYLENSRIPSEKGSEGHATGCGSDRGGRSRVRLREKCSFSPGRRLLRLSGLVGIVAKLA